MKKRKTFIIALGIAFAFLSISNYSFIDNQGNKYETIKELDNPRLKKAGYWNLTGSPIFIDDADSNYNWNKIANDNDWCSGSGIWNDPYIIENVTINGQSADNCIEIRNSSVYFIIKNCTVYNEALGVNSGIKLINVSNGRMLNNTCSPDLWYGIQLKNCHNNLISNNILESNVWGAYLQTSNNNLLSENRVLNNRYSGMLVRSSDFNNISRNILNDNMWNGLQIESGNSNIISENEVNSNDNENLPDTLAGNLFLTGSNNNQIIKNIINNCKNDYGISLWDWNDGNIIVQNIINNNAEGGIRIWGNCNNNIISGNLIKNNSNGIDISNIDCQNNLIYQNSLIGNTRWQAIDYGINNHWNASVIGNYWDNHTSPDSDNDGIVDTPYIWIAGSANNLDHFPLTESPIHVGDKIHIDDSGISAKNWSRTAELKLWCTGSGTYSDPYVIDGLEIDGGGSVNGILIGNSSVYFLIRNCTIYDADNGIMLKNTNNGTLINNNCSQNTRGIQLNTICINNSILNNIAHNNVYGGIVLGSGCNDNIITGNNASNNQHGIYLVQNCDDNIILGNIVNNNDMYGIYLYTDCVNNTISGNTASNNVYGIYLYDSDDNTVSGNTASNNGYGIRLHESSFTNVSGNTASYNYYHGIYLDSSDDNTISGNTASYNYGNGIYLYYSDDNTVSGNTANDNDDGIYLYYSDDNTVSGNTASDNDDGIYLYYSDFNTVLGNIANNNGVHGIRLRLECTTNTISENSLYFNDVYGIYTEDIYCNDNLFYLNEFIGNGVNAFDNGYNKWDNGSIGNYWDDYNYFDLNDDGIGDAPYIIPSNSLVHNVDFYPIWKIPYIKLLTIDIIDLSFSREGFNITLSVYNESNQGIDSVTVQMWWDGDEVSNDVQNLGNGIYFVSLEPIIVEPGEEPILLNMTISANGYEDKSFETYIAVDPDTLDKEGEKPAEEFPLTTFIITISSIAGGIGVAGVSLVLLRRRKRAIEGK